MKKTKHTDAISTYLGASVSISGTIQFKETIRLDGKVKGKVISESGTVIIGEKAVLHADVTADVIILMGEVHGSLEAKDRIEAYPPGRIFGDIKAPVIAVEPGVVLNGNCTMTEPKTSTKTTILPQKIIPSSNDGKNPLKREEKVTKNL